MGIYILYPDSPGFVKRQNRGFAMSGGKTAFPAARDAAGNRDKGGYRRFINSMNVFCKTGDGLRD